MKERFSVRLTNTDTGKVEIFTADERTNIITIPTGVWGFGNGNGGLVIHGGSYSVLDGRGRENG